MNALDEYGRTPLHYAKTVEDPGHADCADLLETAGCEGCGPGSRLSAPATPTQSATNSPAPARRNGTNSSLSVPETIFGVPATPTAVGPPGSSSTPSVLGDTSSMGSWVSTDDGEDDAASSGSPMRDVPTIVEELTPVPSATGEDGASSSQGRAVPAEDDEDTFGFGAPPAVPLDAISAGSGSNASLNSNPFGTPLNSPARRAAAGPVARAAAASGARGSNPFLNMVGDEAEEAEGEEEFGGDEVEDFFAARARKSAAAMAAADPWSNASSRSTSSRSIKVVSSRASPEPGEGEGEGSGLAAGGGGGAKTIDFTSGFDGFDDLDDDMDSFV